MTPAGRSVRADSLEQSATLPGDELIPVPIGSLTHAVNIARSPADVWPWLAQMGAGNRGGWYSYDFLDNGRRPSAERIIPGLQHITKGMVFPALPSRTDGFTVMAFQRDRFLVLGWPGPTGQCLTTWAFVLTPLEHGFTRLVVRARGGQDYRFHGLSRWLSTRLIQPVHFIMERRQLLGIARRAEAAAPASAPERPALDRFIPEPDVRERHETLVHAPAAIVFAAACAFDMQSVPIVRVIFWLRSKLLGSQNAARGRPRGLVEETRGLGWGPLAEVHGRFFIAGAACQPWLADVVFSPIPSDRFGAFTEPEQVKIAWTLETEPTAAAVTRLASETRVVATDREARVKFLRYWRWSGWGIVLIRWLLLPAVKHEAERRWAAARGSLVGYRSSTRAA